MSNYDISATWQYHNATKHSYQSLYESRFSPDLENQPLPFKIYPTLKPIPLPDDSPPLAVSALDAIAAASQTLPGERVPHLQTLARLCFLANGITKYLRVDGDKKPFRAAACTGGLYHIELYLVSSDLPGLAAGVYHFAAYDNSLRQLRAGDFRQVLVQATGAEPSVAQAPVVIICTSTFWRNAWKYQARAYRHSFWDNGTILANLLAIAATSELPAKVVLGFADEPVNRLLHVDAQREAAICLLALGRITQTPPPAPVVQPLTLLTVPLSWEEVDYPAIYAMHAASSQVSGEEVAAWRTRPLSTPRPSSAGPMIPLRPLDPKELPNDPIEDVIRRRGSSRRFAREPITFEQLSTMLDRITRGIPVDYLDPAGGLLSQLYLIVNSVDGLRPGAYVLHQDRRALELLKSGYFRDDAAMLALGQIQGADAAVNIYFLTDLAAVLAHFGNRGYRATQLAAAITAGRLYLAAYAFGQGATGLTFFDDDVTGFFAPHSGCKIVLFLLALGRPSKMGRQIAEAQSSFFGPF